MTGAIAAFEAELSAAPHAPVSAARAVVAGVIALAIAGGALGVHALVTADDARPVPTAVREAPGGGAWTAAASFGTVAVERVERFAGAAPAHGGEHPDRNPAVRHDEVTVFIGAANRLGRPVPFSPGQFRLRLDGTGSTVTAANPNPPPAAIDAGGRLRHQLTFLVPERRTALTLLFHDIGRSQPLAIDLGSLR